MDQIKDLVRSGLTGVGFLVLTGIVAYDAVVNKSAPPQWFTTTVATMIGWWFRGQVENHREP